MKIIFNEGWEYKDIAFDKNNLGLIFPIVRVYYYVDNINDDSWNKSFKFVAISSFNLQDLSVENDYTEVILTGWASPINGIEVINFGDVVTITVESQRFIRRLV